MEIDYEKLRERFHYTAGAYISGKIFAEYAFGLSELFELSMRGEKTKQTKTREACDHVAKYINFIAVDLKRIGVDLKTPDGEVDKLEEIIHATLQLNEVNQKRILGLINKIKKYETEQI
jgi:hypothetical protein